VTKQDCSKIFLAVTFLLGISAPNASANIFYHGIDFQYQGFGTASGVGVGGLPQEFYFGIYNLHIYADPLAYYSSPAFNGLGDLYYDYYGHMVPIPRTSDTALEFTPNNSQPVEPLGFLPPSLGPANFAHDWLLGVNSEVVSPFAMVYFSNGPFVDNESIFALGSMDGEALRWIADPDDVPYGVPLTAGHGAYINIPYFDALFNPLPGPPRYQLLVGNVPYINQVFTIAFLESGDHILSEAPEPAPWALLTCPLGALALLRYLRRLTVSARDSRATDQ
jgi:hypothetical protein